MNSSRPRDNRIDFWRGLCLAGMASWHLLTHPSFPHWLAFGIIQPFNFVAEGFVLLAGTAVGLKIARRRLAPSSALRRSGSILLVHYALVTFVILLGAAELRFGLAVQPDRMPAGIWSVIGLSYQPYLADILTVFVFLFAATPVFQWVYERYGAFVLGAVSVLVFFTAGVAPVNAAGAFVFNSWQIFFVAGMLFGAGYGSHIGALERVQTRTVMLWVGAFAIACAVRFAIGGHDGTVLTGWRTYFAFNRKPLTIPRVVYIGSEMIVIALLSVRWWDRIANSLIVTRLVALGRHSLEVFVCSVVLDYLLKALCTALGVGFPANVLLWMFELGVLLLLVDVIDRRNAWRDSLRITRSGLAVN